MKFQHLLPLVTVSSAFVLPPEEVLAEIPVQQSHREGSGSTIAGWFEELTSAKDDIVEGLNTHLFEAKEATQDAWASMSEHYHAALDDAYEQSSDAARSAGDKLHETVFDVKDWLEGSWDEAEDVFDRPRRPRHPHHEPNLTVYQLIAGSKYTTKLAKLIDEHNDLVRALNSTKANYTVFAPIDAAFEKIPEGAPKPSKDFLKKLLQYHVVPDYYTAGRVFGSHTAPTLLDSPSLGHSPRPQRVAFKLGLRGLSVNFYSRIVAVNILGTNGIVHGVDSLLVPPPAAIPTIDLFPGEFSTLELGLEKTGLLEKLNTTKHAGGTFFAPSNFAFQKLGPRINAFLFSKYGTKYLKALLEYHVVHDHTLYSDAYYDASKDKHDDDSEGSVDEEDVSKGYFHYDLPTLLKDRRLAVDVARYGRFITMKINAFSRVAVQDGIVADGVIHIVSDVLIPPKRILTDGKETVEPWNGEMMDPEELMERLDPFVPKGDL